MSEACELCGDRPPSIHRAIENQPFFVCWDCAHPYPGVDDGLDFIDRYAKYLYPGVILGGGFIAWLSAWIGGAGPMYGG